MLRNCSDYPGTEDLENLLKNMLKDNQQVTYKEWIHTDRSEICTVTLEVDDFIEKYIEKILKLKSHHYINKAQSGFLKKQKEELNEDTAIILMDFAENYSFKIQDAIQANHWDYSQATLHPFAIYIKKDDEAHCISFYIIYYY